MFDEAVEHLFKKTVFDAMWIKDDYSIVTSDSVEKTVDYISNYCIPEDQVRDVLNGNTIRLINGSQIKVVEDIVGKVMNMKREEQKSIKEIAESGVGVKDLNGKPDWSLVDLKNLEGLVRGLEYGCRKYSRDNWKKVSDPGKNYYAAAIRHLSEWHHGDRKDKESGLSHLAHAMCNIYFLTYFENKEDME